jgi:hypothetical protein
MGRRGKSVVRRRKGEGDKMLLRLSTPYRSPLKASSETFLPGKVTLSLCTTVVTPSQSWYDTLSISDDNVMLRPFPLENNVTLIMYQ